MLTSRTPRLKIILDPETKALREHWLKLKELRCVVSGNPLVTAHHCKGGSMCDLLGDAGNPGVGKKVSDWLVIPLSWRFHTGDNGIDNGLTRDGKDKRYWEARFGTQVNHLITVSKFVGYSVFKRAGFDVAIPELKDLP